MNAGVLRHIGDGIGQDAVHRIGDILVGGLEGAFNRVACAIVFGHFGAVGGGGDNRDICLRGDVVAHVALGNVGIQFIHDNLQIDCAVRPNHITARGHLFFQHFLQQEAQVAGGGPHR